MGNGGASGGGGPAGGRFRDASPQAEAAEAAIDAACAGREIELTAVLADARCAISSTVAKQLRARLERDGGRLPFKQEATLLGEGRVRMRLLNIGDVPLVLPLSFHAKLPSFTAFAEDAEHHTVYELGAPRFDPMPAPPPATVPGAAGGNGPRFARISLAPGAAASAVVVIDTAVVQRIDPPCEAGTCAGPSLAKGSYSLYLGELVTDVEAGPPARLAWTVP